MSEFASKKNLDYSNPNRKKILNYQEKLDLVIEYLESEEGKNNGITSNTVYKGYHLGNIRSNLRNIYWRGQLNIDDKLIKEFKRYGILTEKPTRIRVSAQKKYQFLISQKGKSKKELKKARMENGWSFSDVRNSVQHLYNTGKLNLTDDQIEELRKNHILNISPEEKQLFEKNYDIPLKDIKKIVTQYGSMENFIEKYKKGECEYDFDKKTFVGQRVIAISKKDRLLKQKSGYVQLWSKLEESENILDTYWDIDAIENSIKKLNKNEQEILILKYGINDGKPKTYREVAEIKNVTPNAILATETRARKKLKILSKKNKVIYKKENIKEVEKELSKINQEKEDIYELEKLLIHYNKEENKEISLEEIEVHLSDDLINKYIYYLTPPEPIDTLQSLDLYIDRISYIVEEYYKELSNKIYQEEILNLRKEQNKDFLSVYKPAEKEYLENENIFNPNYIVKKTKAKQNMTPKNANKKSTIYNLPLKNFIALVYLHHSGINTLDDLIARAEANKGTEDFVNSIKCINEDEKKKLIKFFNNKSKNIERDVDNEEMNHSLREIGLSNRSYNALRRFGIKDDLYDLLNKIKTEEELIKIKGLGKKAIEEIVEKVHNMGYKFQFEQNSEEEKSIKILGLSTRAYNALNRMGIKNIYDLINCIKSEGDLRKIGCLGSILEKEIIENMHKMGYKFEYETKKEGEKKELIEKILKKQDEIYNQNEVIKGLKNENVQKI